MGSEDNKQMLWKNAKIVTIWRDTLSGLDLIQYYLESDILYH